jgi:hypothetical protein
VITGHLGIAGFARSLQRDRPSTAVFVALLLASLAPDCLDVLYALFGVCNPYGLYSHTVHSVVVQAAVIGGAALLVTGSRGLAVTFASVVLLHIVGDYFTGQKLLLPGGELVGLRWYDRPLLDFLLELPILVGGWWMLRRSGQAARWAVSVRTVALMVLLQTAFDIRAALSKQGIKPNACLEQSTQTRASLAVPQLTTHVGRRP